MYKQQDVAESEDNIVDFDLSESKYNVPVNPSPRNQVSVVKMDPTLMSMDSMDFGLSESNFSQVIIKEPRSLIRASTEKIVKKIVELKDESDYSDTFN